MNHDYVAKVIADFICSSDLNVISADMARHPDLIGLRIFDGAIVGIADANDPVFESFKSPDVVGMTHMSPHEWLPGSKSTISFFLPFTEAIRRSNSISPDLPSDEWLHGRIDGQSLIASLSKHICTDLTEQGYRCICPTLDPRFKEYKQFEDDSPRVESCWSERHVAFAAGIGTFGLSCGIITKRGMAGRLGSVITTLDLEPTARPYKASHEYCTSCLACIGRCPVRAITKDGKNHAICSRHVYWTRERYSPYYGCGKCQVNVPCENGIPGRIH